VKVANIGHRAHLVEGGLASRIEDLGEMLHDVTGAATAAREHRTPPGRN
jgi:hypothetical protein